MSNGYVSDPRPLKKEFGTVNFERYSAVIFSDYRQLLLMKRTYICRHGFSVYVHIKTFLIRALAKRRSGFKPGPEIDGKYALIEYEETAESGSDETGL